MAYTAEQYRRAISGLESGGNYAAVGTAGKGANRPLGRYQVMSDNLGPWLRQYLGKTGISADDFLADPGLQDQLFDAVFGSYVKEHGDRGAASMWFTGSPDEPNRSDVHGKLTGKSYTDRFIQNLGQPADRSDNYQTARDDTPSYAHPTSDTFKLPKVDTAYGDSPSETGGVRFGGTGLGTPLAATLTAEKETSPWPGGGEMPEIPQQPAYQLTPQPAATVAKAAPAPMVNVEQQMAQRQQLAQLLAQLNAPLQQRQQV